MIWPRASRIGLKLLGRLPCVIGFILTHHMHVRFCIEKKFTHDSLILGGRRSTWSTAGRPTRMALKLLVRLPCVIGFILTHHMHVRFCLEKKLTHDSLIFDGRRSTWSTAGLPTRMALKLLGRLPCVIGIILTHHMHVRFCLEKNLTHDSLIFDGRRSTRSTDSDGLETSRRGSLCDGDHFDSAFAREILPRKKGDPRLIDF
ncbi:uncharacterized protein G2W53_044955 [Senna tora]|uniref:Uncharacterized protein n=1 Tax=Senna tora TaxID=362788 RepID=A0A834SE24_9FABA|nr:uncharacterized protein G2W53_044955 [Senna tora]